MNTVQACNILILTFICKYKVSLIRPRRSGHKRILKLFVLHSFRFVITDCVGVIFLGLSFSAKQRHTLFCPHSLKLSSDMYGVLLEINEIPI